MKILHTSDWHLGQRFLFNDREEEHQRALDWLADTIREQEVEVLVVAGDVFDINNPPNYARTMYYRFLTSLLGSCCRHIVIVGGNHDSPSMLNAPRELLRLLNIHVVGAASEDPVDEIIELEDAKGKLELVVAAVPFLRDRDLRFSQSGEGSYERLQKVREGMAEHYRRVGEMMEPYRKNKIPLLATGHLYASGAMASGKQDNIYAGDVENIEADQFPDVFHYIALGHIHRPQLIDGQQHIRYSGSLIPLSFSETKDDKSVFILYFQKDQLMEVETVMVPVFRRLKSISGTLQEVKESLRRFSEKGDRDLTPWVEVIVQTDRLIPRLDLTLRDFTRDMDLRLLKIKIERSGELLKKQQAELVNLSDLEDVESVFKKKCLRFGSPPEQMDDLLDAFRELKSNLDGKR
ncbi:MAG: exonuclease SbcCD subunit D C-terminal domain-containing protein [Saprospiraceae bacterium]|nr:exonuclease SbcCD subunit D C-terminal domain-containing protein [Lewinella sp.]